MEFLLRTRHPELSLTFGLFSTGGGTFQTGLDHLDQWLQEFKPTLVFFNYGANDAAAGRNGLPTFQRTMQGCVEKAEAAGARVILVTHQAADVRKSGVQEAANRELYADNMIAFGKEKGWRVIDVFHPLKAMLLGAQKDDPSYTMLIDHIHLTDPAYVGWGYFLYGRLDPPPAETSAELSANGRSIRTRRCKISNVKAQSGMLSFTRQDDFLPILPPVGLPPRPYVPLETLSRYILRVRGLPAGMYQVSCEGKPIGVVDSSALAKGINLNSLLLSSGNPAPWTDLAKELWDGKSLEQVGHTEWSFVVQKQP